MVIVDGYNVTRSNVDHLSLEKQRDWLKAAATRLAASRGVRPRLVFDAANADTPPRSRRDPRSAVEVRFVPKGTADDAIVEIVEALPGNEPIVVVTDDRDLRDRLRRHQVDLLHTGPFVATAQ